MSFVIGIDEAGWGPVFGPLVTAGVVMEELTLPRLEKYGVKDSKLFGSDEKARKKRKEVWEKTYPHLLGYSVQIVTAEELDNGNTIDLEIKSIARILRELDFARREIMIIGMLGKLGKEKFVNRISHLLDLRGIRKDLFRRNLRYEKKADRNYLPVSAASILAKITRDQKVEELCSSLGENYISGYPNYRTALFLKKYYQKKRCLPPEIRKTRDWLPLQELIDETRKNAKLRQNAKIFL